MEGSILICYPSLRAKICCLKSKVKNKNLEKFKGYGGFLRLFYASYVEVLYWTGHRAQITIKLQLKLDSMKHNTDWLLGVTIPDYLIGNKFEITAW